MLQVDPKGRISTNEGLESGWFVARVCRRSRKIFAPVHATLEVEDEHEMVANCCGGALQKMEDKTERGIKVDHQLAHKAKVEVDDKQRETGDDEKQGNESKLFRRVFMAVFINEGSITWVS